MIYIKLDDSMNLVITVNEPIYRGDNLNQKIIYLIPLQVGEIDMLTATPYLSYIRADGVADIVRLERQKREIQRSLLPICISGFLPTDKSSPEKFAHGFKSSRARRLTRPSQRVASVCFMSRSPRTWTTISATISFRLLRDAEEDRGHGEQYGRHPRGD